LALAGGPNQTAPVGISGAFRCAQHTLRELVRVAVLDGTLQNHDYPRRVPLSEAKRTAGSTDC